MGRLAEKALAASLTNLVLFKFDSLQVSQLFGGFMITKKKDVL